VVIVSFYRLRKRNRAIIAEKVRVTGWRVEIHLKIPLPDDPHTTTRRNLGPTRTTDRQAICACVPLVSTDGQDSYRLAQATIGKGVKPLN
jgi:hypothetical protein